MDLERQITEYYDIGIERMNILIFQLVWLLLLAPNMVSYRMQKRLQCCLEDVMASLNTKYSIISSYNLNQISVLSASVYIFDRSYTNIISVSIPSPLAIRSSSLITPSTTNRYLIDIPTINVSMLEAIDLGATASSTTADPFFLLSSTYSSLHDSISHGSVHSADHPSQGMESFIEAPLPEKWMQVFTLHTTLRVRLYDGYSHDFYSVDIQEMSQI